MRVDRNALNKQKLGSPPRVRKRSRKSLGIYGRGLKSLVPAVCLRRIS